MPATETPLPADRPAGGRRPGHRPPPREVEVLSTTALTPRLRSVVFTGDALAGFAEPAPTAHIKLFLPDADGSLRAPAVGPDGDLTWPQGRPTMRTYTPRRFDADARTLEVWIVLHGDGPAATWAATARPGDRAAIGGPGGRFNVDPTASRWWIGGDASALPAIATLLEALPGEVETEVHLETEHPADEMSLPGHPGATVHWHARPEDVPPGETLADALATSAPGEETHLWAGCEAAAVRRIRAHALGGLGLPAANVTTRGYWKLGAADHPDHDFGTEDLAVRPGR